MLKEALMALGLALSQPAAAKLRIMPLGDSVTEFIREPSCPEGYRYELFKALVDRGVDFEMVGTRTWPDQPAYRGRAFDPRHMAIGGWSAYDFAHGKPSDGWGGYEGNIDTMVWKLWPEVVLIGLGINDSWGNRPAGDYDMNMRFIVQSIRRRNPGARILVGTLVNFAPPFDQTSGRMIPAYNEVIWRLGSELGLEVVDLTRGYDPAADASCDRWKIHPGPSGARKLGQTWAKAVVGY